MTRVVFVSKIQRSLLVLPPLGFLAEFTLSKHEGLGTRTSRFTRNDKKENYDTVSKSGMIIGVFN